MPDPTRRVRSVRGLGAAFASLCAISIIVVVGLGFLIVYIQDRNAIAASERIVQGNIRSHVRTHETLVKEYGYWDLSVQNIVESLDIEWVESEYGEYLYENGQVSALHVLDGEGRIVLGQTEGVTDDPPGATPLAAGEKELAKRALATSEDNTEPVAVSGYTRHGDVLNMSSAIRMTTYKDDEDISTDHVMVFHWRMDEEFIAELERSSLVRNLMWQTGEAGYGTASVAIDLPGNQQTRLVWQPDLPGSRMLPLLVVGMFGFVLLLLLLGLIFIRRMSAHAQQLEVAQIASDEANQQKSDFLASMSHELRTPLNAILGFAEIMKKQYLGPVGNTRYLEYADDIHKSGSHLLSLVNGLLDLSKIEAGKFDLDLQKLRLAVVTDQSLKMVEHLASDKGIALECTLAPEADAVMADERALRQVLVNILGNALKFTPDGGRVQLASAAGRPGMAEIRITDTGAGIRESDIPKILEPFFQVREEGFRKHTGTGLGLPVSRKLIELMGGSLTIESQVGQGTTVIILLRTPEAAGRPVSRPAARLSA